MVGYLVDAVYFTIQGTALVKKEFINSKSLPEARSYQQIKDIAVACAQKAKSAQVSSFTDEKGAERTAIFQRRGEVTLIFTLTASNALGESQLNLFSIQAALAQAVSNALRPKADYDLELRGKRDHEWTWVNRDSIRANFVPLTMLVDALFDGSSVPGGALPTLLACGGEGQLKSMEEILRKGLHKANENYMSKAMDMMTSATQAPREQYWAIRQATNQLVDNPLALWRTKRSKTQQPKTFEEQKALAESSLTQSVASARSYLGSWIGSFTGGGSTQAKPPTKQELQRKTAQASKTGAPDESVVSFEHMVKDCSADLIEWAECIVYVGEEERIDSIEVAGEIQVKASIPGDAPKVQVKVSLPEDYDEMRVHPLCLLSQKKQSDAFLGQASEEEELTYRLGVQKFGVASIVPPSCSGSPFSLMHYISREDKSLRLPFSMRCSTSLSHSSDSGHTFDFKCAFILTQLQDMDTNDFYFPMVKRATIDIHFPPEVTEANLVSSLCSNPVQIPVRPQGVTQSEVGSFEWEESSHRGLWRLAPWELMKDDQDKSCEKLLLQGTLKSEDSMFSSDVVAVVNAAVHKFSFSGARIDKLEVNQKPGISTAGLDQFRDDPSINRTTRSMAFAKNIEFRFH